MTLDAVDNVGKLHATANVCVPGGSRAKIAASPAHSGHVESHEVGWNVAPVTSEVTANHVDVSELCRKVTNTENIRNKRFF